jgi:Mobilization protein NikA
LHLNFSDTSPLKEFAFCLRCRQIVYIRRQIVYNVNASIAGDTRLCIQTHTSRLVCRHFVDIVDKHLDMDRMDRTLMQGPKLTRVITFRVSEEEWFRIQQAAGQSGKTPNEWCRIMALERLNLWSGMSRNQLILFSQIARCRFLVENAFQLLAEDKLQSHVWRSYRDYAKGNLQTIVEQALAECSPQRQELSATVDVVGIKR